MIFQDNVIKEYLKNVYFISGTPCGGKTTISRELARRHNLAVYDIDEQFACHQKISNAAFQPSMNKTFQDADAFFGRTVEEYKKWLIDNTREQLDFVLLDLIRLSQNKTVLCDCHLTVEEARKYTEASRIVFLIKEPSNLVEEYCNRPDHQGFRDFINSASDIEKAKATCNATLKTLNEKRCHDIKSSNYLWIERTPDSTVEETVRKVEQHFGLGPKDFGMDTLEIRRKTMLVSSYIYIPVADLEKAADWYEENLDFHVIYKDSLYYDVRTDNGVKIMLIPGEKKMNSQMQYATGQQPAYGFCVDDFDAIKEKLEQNGVKIGETYDYFGRSFSFFDPDGNKIEIWEDFSYDA